MKNVQECFNQECEYSNNTLKEMVAAALGHYICAVRSGKAF